MTFYVASSFKNTPMVRAVTESLRIAGHRLTYDWTQNERASTAKDLERIGQDEKRAILEADVVIVLLPGGKGTHVDLGLALAWKKSIYLYWEVPLSLNERTTYYHLPEIRHITGELDEFLLLINNHYRYQEASYEQH
ncbi:group-specific protein [Rossellomorea marisflavi]|uniref:group-specific protein n=1 Tax=Rossellomorea marisflavi TaxID=189381 RepID=UPI0034576C6A